MQRIGAQKDKKFREELKRAMIHGASMKEIARKIQLHRLAQKSEKFGDAANEIQDLKRRTGGNQRFIEKKERELYSYV